MAVDGRRPVSLPCVRVTALVSGRPREHTGALLYGKPAPVVIYNDGDTSIGSQLCEPRFLLDVLHDVDALENVVFAVCLLELFKQDRSLVPYVSLSMWPALPHDWLTVGCAKGQELDALVRNQT